MRSSSVSPYCLATTYLFPHPPAGIVLSDNPTKKQTDIFEDELIGYLEQFSYGYRRAEDAICAAVQRAGIEKENGYRLVNDMICAYADMYLTREGSILDASDLPSGSNTRCIQAWGQNMTIKQMCLRMSDDDLVNKFTKILDAGLVKYSFDVCDVMIAPRDLVVEYTCKRMKMPQENFDVFFQHVDDCYSSSRDVDEDDGEGDDNEYDEDVISKSLMLPPLPEIRLLNFFTPPPTDHNDAVLALLGTPLPPWAIRVDSI